MSEKRQVAEDEWRHESIRLLPLNPEFEPISLDEGDFRVVAEWLRVLD